MLIEERLKEIQEKIKKKVPKGIKVASVEFEGPELVIYTDDPKTFADQDDLIKILARDIRKRIVVRPTILEDPERAASAIRRVVGENAGISDIFFEADSGEVLIEAEKPGVVIGKNGATLRDITREIGWTPKVVRTPPIESSTVKQVRQYLRAAHQERKELLKRIGRRIHRDVISKDQWIRVTTLGCCREVGRAAFLLSTPESRVLIDCGEKPDSFEATPYLYVPEIHPLSQLDAVVLTHAHLDHCAYIPLLYKYGYEGPVYSTPPTRDLAAMLQLDYLDVVNKEGKTIPYSSNEVKEYIKHSIVLNYGCVTDIAPDIKLTFHNAGHILGSGIAHFHIGDGLYNVAFTGDLHYGKSRLFNAAVNHYPRLEALFMESTYGGAQDMQPSRAEAEERLYGVFREVLERGGKIIIPAFAVGRSQEVMLAIEEGMRLGKFPPVKVYLDGMIKEATAIHTTYPEYLNSELRNLIFKEGHNPFLAECFEQVDSAEKRERVITGEPCVIITTSGMLNGGPVMEYLRNLAADERNCLVFVGYQADGTLGRRIQKGWREIPIGNRETIVVNLDCITVDGFSGHSDRRQLMNFVSHMQPKPEKIFAIHGDENKTIDLASSIYKKLHIQTTSPMNLETYRLI
ncbi:beta-CASP ribonuclease aCPSF1 [Methanospirillum sp. J.3.6.1-F.2.7.3]|jgi:KH/beta-lactamase-domain protein|uniref:Transcription termination factor FttA n=2 Tax=Methanospirillum TaxID=2202 RepID=A0A8E7AY34_9EURY|nr:MULTISPECIES: beta-CASP ribonuclease aCPSF1 [Methanospirillum]MDX8551002.1 beta-CASP ribonuclease aCPSF1 [Methanospirillum hungatei]QVV87578.1 beta-CASP ribonuclease aCPSF1 [Methanospirillum sp. J.3.6.1-F.2.7.3]QXO95043.1 beta-CASP ribonuclease aCPSF1 [Methanospirillum hungatei]